MTIHIKRACTVTGEYLYSKQVNYGSWLTISEDEFHDIKPAPMEIVHHEGDEFFQLTIWKIES